MAAAAGVISLSGAFAVWRRLRLRLPAFLAPLPYEVALGRCDEARRRMTPGLAADFRATLNEALADHLRARLGLRDRTAATPLEFLRNLVATREPLLPSHRWVLDEFLQAHDLCVAQGDFPQSALADLMECARTVILQTAVGPMRRTEMASLTLLPA